MKKKITFLISLFSPLLPVLAVLILNRIGQALPLLVLSGIILIAILYSITALIRLEEKSPGMKVVGTIMGIAGILVTAVVLFVSGFALTKI
jgi:VIT1/CCC1 family predicted Fe2+/Mn2+ transporter